MSIKTTAEKYSILMGVVFTSGLVSCQSQLMYAPYFVYENRLKHAKSLNVENDIICRISGKRSANGLYLDNFHFYYQNKKVDPNDFRELYGSKIGKPTDYKIVIRNWMGIKLFEWIPDHFNVDISPIARSSL